MNDDTSTIKGLEEGRAIYAYGFALDGKKIIQKAQIGNQWFEDDKYKSYVKKIPMLIKTNGLGSTLAFIKSKRKKTGENSDPKNAYDLIYQQIKQWLVDEKKLLNIGKDDDLVEKIISLDSPMYRAITNEVLSLFNWLKRFADGLIEDDSDK